MSSDRFVTVCGAHATIPTDSINIPLTVGKDGTGYDVKFFGDTSGTYFLWDQSADTLILTNAKQTITNTTAAAGAYTGLYTTITTGLTHTGNVAGIRSIVQTDNTGDSIANIFALMSKAMLRHASDVVTGTMTALLAQIDMGAVSNSNAANAWGICIDMLETGTRAKIPVAFMRFVDYDYDGSAPTNYLFDFGATGNQFPVGTGKISYNQTLACRLNGADLYLVCSTAEGTFTTAYPIVSTNTTDSTSTASGAIYTSGGLGVAKCAYFGDHIVANISTGVHSYPTGIYETMTITGAVTGSAVGLRSIVTMGGSTYSVGNMFGISCAARLVNAGDVSSGNMTGLLTSIDMGASTTANQWAYALQCDITEIVTRAAAPRAFIGFQDYDYAGSYPVKYIFDFGSALCGVASGSGKCTYNETLKVCLNNADRWIPLSTVEGTYTTAYPIDTTNKITAFQNTGAANYYTGLYELLTITGINTGSTVGLRSIVVMGGTTYAVGNMFGISCAARLVNVTDVASGNMTGLLTSIDMGLSNTAGQWAYPLQCDITEISTRAAAPRAFIGFQDYDFAGSFPVTYVFDFGSALCGIASGSGKCTYNDTLKVALNNVARWIPLSSVEGTYTTAYPIVTTSTITSTVAVNALSITCGTLTNTDGRIAVFKGTQATPNMNDGYGMVEIETTVSGIATGFHSPLSSWVNITGSGAIGANIVCAQQNGIYSDSGGNTGSIVIFGMRAQAQLTDAPTVLAPFSLNTANRAITALFEMSSNPDVGYQANAGETGPKVGDVPLFCDNNGTQYFVRIYSARG